MSNPIHEEIMPQRFMQAFSDDIAAHFQENLVKMGFLVQYLGICVMCVCMNVYLQQPLCTSSHLPTYFCVSMLNLLPDAADPLYVAYHDEEWGVPVYDDR
jgi:hypothetical protein